MNIKTLAFAVITTLLASSAVAQSALPTVVDDSFNLRVLNWRNGSGRTMVRWSAVIVDGNIAICGAHATRGGRKYTSLSRQVVADIRILRNGNVFLAGLNFSAIHGSRAFGQNLVGSKVNCRVSTVPGTTADLSAFRAHLIPRHYNTR